MKKSVEERIPGRANNELSLLLFFLLLALLSQLGNQLFFKNSPGGLEEFAQVIVNNKSYLIEPKKFPNPKSLASNCPEGTVQELDLVMISREKCELIPKGASNWVRLASGKKMLLNQASAPELEFLPRIGSKRAQEILRLRQELQRFENFDQLRQLPWVKSETIEEFQHYFTIKDF